MSKRVGGFINQDGLNAPDEPTNVSASAGDTQATVSFTAPSNVGGSAITGYVATSNNGIGATGSSSPITVSGLTNGTAYTFRVWALNAFGYSSPSDASGSVTPAPPIAVFYAGESSTGLSVNTIDFVTISSTGNATDFGDLTGDRRRSAGTGSSTRGLVMGGRDSNTNGIEFITYASAGNASDFGDLLGDTESQAACASSTRSAVAGGNVFNGGEGITNVVQYVTTATTGDSIDFGDLTQARQDLAGFSSPTRGVFGGGRTSGTTTTHVSTIDFITIASTGNASSFGSLTETKFGLAGCSSSTRGLFGGGRGSAVVNVIEFVTIASTGNGTDFGDLSSIRRFLAAASSEVRGVFAGGNSDSGGSTIYNNAIDYVTIATAGNSLDFGDLTFSRVEFAASSSAHGGLS